MTAPPGETRRAWPRLAVFGMLLGALFVLGLVLAPHSAHRLRHDLGGLGAWGPIAMIGLAALLTCAFVPGPVLAGASGLLFGTLLGTGVAIASATTGASAAFLIGRRLARKPYGSVAQGRLRDWTTRIEDRGFLAVLYARIAPGAPFALVSYAAGLTRIRLGVFAAGTAIGASPRAFAYAALGGTLGHYNSPKALAAIGVLVAMAIGGGALLWRSSPPQASQSKESFGRRQMSKLRMSRSQASAEIMLYTLPWCVHCARAKAVLKRRGLAFEEVDGTAIPDFRRQLAQLTGGVTVPQIVIDGTPIGGANRLNRLDRIGVLEAIANDEPFPIVRESRLISPGSVIRWAAARVRGDRDVSPFRRVHVRINRSGQVVETDPTDPQGAKEESDGEGMFRSAG